MVEFLIFGVKSAKFEKKIKGKSVSKYKFVQLLLKGLLDSGQFLCALVLQ